MSLLIAFGHNFHLVSFSIDHDQISTLLIFYNHNFQYVNRPWMQLICDFKGLLKDLIMDDFFMDKYVVHIIFIRYKYCNLNEIITFSMY